MDEIGQLLKSINTKEATGNMSTFIYGQTTIVPHEQPPTTNTPMTNIFFQRRANVLRFLVETLIRWSVTNGKTNFN
jgi:hypothetical protein